MDIQDTEFGLRYLTQVVAKLKKIGLWVAEIENTTFAVNATAGDVTSTIWTRMCTNFTHKASGISIGW
jgi:hypothetical protein